MRVPIVISVLDEREHLDALLQHAKASPIEHEQEIIVVDDCRPGQSERLARRRESPQAHSEV
jgi:glycosyltransferase involved in cell wall biosynthesis